MKKVSNISFFAILLNLMLAYCGVSHGKENIKEYHELITQAAIEISCGKYNEALKKYHAAFNVNSEPFAIDIYNKMQLAIILEEHEVALDNAKRLVSEKGLSIAAFEDGSGYKKFRTNEVYWQQFKEWYPIGRQEFLNNSNQDDIAFFRKLLDDDQKFRVSEERYTTYRFQNDSIDQQNMQLLKEYIEKNGYPSENRIGVFETSYRGGTGFKDYLIILLRHYFSGFSNFSFDLSSVLLEAVKSGTLHPQLFYMYMMQIIEYKTEDKYIMPAYTNEASVIFIINNNHYISILEEDLIDISDSIRSELNLPSSREFHDISIFNVLNKDLGFELIYANKSVVFDLAEPEQESLLVELMNLKLIQDAQVYTICD